MEKQSESPPTPTRDEVLKRMLKMKPAPHKAAGKPAKHIEETARLASSVERNKNPNKPRGGK